MRRIRFLVAIIGAVFMAVLDPYASVSAADEAPGPAQLAEMLPAATNKIVVLNVNDILKLHRESNATDEQFLFGAVEIPHWVETLVLGSLIQPASNERLWTAATLTATRRVSIKQLAIQSKSDTEQLAGRPATRSKNGMYVVGLQSGVVAAFSPPIRQLTARWVRSLEDPQRNTISPFLKQATASNAHVTIALDMQDMLDPQRTRAFVAAMPDFRNKLSASREIGQLLADAVGATITCDIGKSVDAKLRIQFSRKVSLPTTQLKAVFLEIVHRSGASLEELQDAEYSVDGNEFVVAAELSESSFRLLMSLIVTPSLPHQNSESSSSPPPAASVNENDEVASRHYYLAVDDAIGDLSRLIKKQSTYDRALKWHESCARKILDLKSEGVDPDLVEFGQSVSRHLRSLIASIRGLGVELEAGEQSITTSYNYDPGWAGVTFWGGVYGKAPSVQENSNLTQVRERQAQAVAAGAQQREEIWLQIENERSQIKQQMQSRYGQDFVKPRRRGR